jgi:hypothetical protein
MEDERQVELDCIAAIFPEILLDPDNPFSASIELPIHPNQSCLPSFCERRCDSSYPATLRQFWRRTTRSSTSRTYN